LISGFTAFAQSITQKDRAKANSCFVTADWQNAGKHCKFLLE